MDGDSIWDYEEIMFEYTNKNGVTIPTIDITDVNNPQPLKFEQIRNIVCQSNGNNWFDGRSEPDKYDDGDLFYVRRGLDRYMEETGQTEQTVIASLLDVYVLPIKSDPTDPDGDGDGYTDGNINSKDCDKINTPRPLLCDVYNYRLKNMYTSIDFATLSYGGDQGWFSDYRIQNGGCGLISFSDLLIYLSYSDGFKSFSLFEKYNRIDKVDYVKYVLHISEKYLYPIIFPDIISRDAGTYGILPVTYVNAFMRFTNFYNNALLMQAYSFNPNALLGNKEYFVRIISNCIEKNYPIPLRIGLLSDNLFTYIDGPTATLPEQNVSYHWVNIIGIYSNSISCEEKIIVTS